MDLWVEDLGKLGIWSLRSWFLGALRPSLHSRRFNTNKSLLRAKLGHSKGLQQVIISILDILGLLHYFLEIYCWFVVYLLFGSNMMMRICKTWVRSVYNHIFYHKCWLHIETNQVLVEYLSVYCIFLVSFCLFGVLDL